MLIGRSRRCDVTLGDSSLVSRRHCRLVPRDSGYFLRDLGSQNGTWVDGERIDHAFLQEGDRFVVGDVVLRVRRGAVEEEGRANPRSVRERPSLRDQSSALAMISVPLLGGILLLVLSGPDRAPISPEEAQALRALAAERAREGTDAPESPIEASTTPEGASDDPAEARDAVPNPNDSGGGPGADEPTRRYSFRELMEIAETVDRDLATRELEMEALLASGRRPETEIDRALASGDLIPRPLEESWSGIVGDAPELARAGRLTPAPSPPRSDASPAATTPPSTGESSKERGHTEVITVPPPAPEPLFPEGAREDLARAIVEEGKGYIDRYHVRDVSYAPLRPLIGRIRDLDGGPAAHGLLELRGHTHEKLRTVYRRAQKLRRDADRAGQDLTTRPKGGADEREDELTLRLAALVQEHLETLVLIRDEIDGALLRGGNPRFIVEALSVSVETKEQHLFDQTIAAITLYETREAIPVLIEAVGSYEPSIRRRSRETLESITGARPGTSRRAWREWWRDQGPRHPSGEKEA